MNSRFFVTLRYFCVAFILLIGLPGCEGIPFPDFIFGKPPGGEGLPPAVLPPPSPSVPQSRVWYVSEDGNDHNTGLDGSSMLASVPAALARIKSVYRSGKWPAGESAVIMIKGRIVAPRDLGFNESMVEITGKNNYPPIVLLGDPSTGGVLDADRKGDDGRVLFITNNKVTLGENLTLTGGNQLWGGAVCIGVPGLESEGEFIMAGGEISGNIGASGGAIVIYKGKMTMSGGVIKNNRNNYLGSGGYGSGIYVYEYTTFIMTGGRIESNGDNLNAGQGGGLFIDGRGTAIMEDGEIINNRSSIQGGGVCIMFKGTFEMRGGLIKGNSSPEGGGIYTMSGGIYTNTGGKVEGNTPDNTN